MRKDPTEFRKRFEHWKSGKDVYKDGRPVDDEVSYREVMKDVARENYEDWGYSSPQEAWRNELNNPTYDYRGYYTDPQFYQKSSDSKTHWPDKYKTPLHKTFSDESIYHGKVSEKNPYGLRGELWVGDKFIPAAWLRRILPKFEDGKSAFPRFGNGEDNNTYITSSGPVMPPVYIKHENEDEFKRAARPLERIANFAPYVGTILDWLSVTNDDYAKIPSAVIGTISDVFLPGLFGQIKRINLFRKLMKTSPRIADKLKYLTKTNKETKKAAANGAYLVIGTYDDILDDLGLTQ